MYLLFEVKFYWDFWYVFGIVGGWGRGSVKIWVYLLFQVFELEIFSLEM